HIPVNNATIVTILQRFKHRANNLADFGLCEPLVIVELALKAWTGDKLHHEVSIIGRLTVVVDADDIGMIELSRSLGAALEAGVGLLGFGVVDCRQRYELDCNAPGDRGI